MLMEFYSCNPTVSKNCKIIENVNYELAQEISSMGGKILHPYCIKPCQEKNILNINKKYL